MTARACVRCKHVRLDYCSRARPTRNNPEMRKRALRWGRIVADIRQKPHASGRCARRILVTSLAFQGMVTYLVTRTVDSAPGGVLVFIERFTLCTVIFSAVELAKSLLARLLSLRVHSAALFDALEVRARCLRRVCAWRSCAC